MTKRPTEEEATEREAGVLERRDADGNVWRKIYVGGGTHFRNWLEQCREIYLEEDLEVEEADAAGFACYERQGERMYRIWLRVREKPPCPD